MGRGGIGKKRSPVRLHEMAGNRINSKNQGRKDIAYGR